VLLQPPSFRRFCIYPYFGGWALYKSPLSDVTPSRMLRTQPYTAYSSPELTAVASDLNTGWTALHTTAVRLY
jgi:hypothetical protein